MAFTMPCCANTKAAALLLIGLAPLPSTASPYAAEISQAQLAVQGRSYLLSAQIHYRLSDRAIEALKNGVPLYWTLHINLKQRRAWFWDKTLLTRNQAFRIDYHALLNQYRWANPQTGQSQSFATLSAAMELMSTIHNLPVTDSRLIEPLIDLGESLYAELKISFDGDRLPLPLRPIAAIDPQWALSSPWTLWPLTK